MLLIILFSSDTVIVHAFKVSYQFAYAMVISFDYNDICKQSVNCRQQKANILGRIMNKAATMGVGELSVCMCVSVRCDIVIG